MRVATRHLGQVRQLGSIRFVSRVNEPMAPARCRNGVGWLHCGRGARWSPRDLGAPETMQEPQHPLSGFVAGLRNFVAAITNNADQVLGYLGASAQRGKGPWKFVSDLMPFQFGLGLLLAVEAFETGKPRAEDLVAHALRRPLGNPTLLGALRDAIVAEETPLDMVHRRQVGTGLDYIESEDFDLAGPLLISAIEGIFWRQAALRGVIKKRKGDKWQTAVDARPVGGLEALIALPEMQLESSLRDCLRAVIYGTAAHPFRHGNAVGGWQLRSMLLVGALIGLLGWLGSIDQRTIVFDALRQESGTVRIES